MRKPRWKAFVMDDMHTVAARSWKDAADWFMKESGIGQDEIYFPPYQKNLKDHMEYDIEEIPYKRYRRITYVDNEGRGCVEITFKKALKYQLKLHKHKEPFILAFCP